MHAWKGIAQPPLDRPRWFAWPLLIVRVVLISALVLTLFVPLIILRAVGFKVVGQMVVKFACRGALMIMGIGFTKRGRPMQHAGAVVANHSSWLDIFTLNAAQKVYFVSKDDVEGWPLIGFIAKKVGTVFIRRVRSDAARQKNVFLDRISHGEKLLFFPEGTSTDGRRVLPFKSSLFAAYFEEGLPELTWIQPVTVNYIAPDGKRRNWYGWWFEMGFFEAVGMVLSKWKQGSVEIIFHAPLDVAKFENRKTLALAAETAVLDGLHLR
jgi:1-acyl-sn-glycerol-3-phosphate acyltransferase